MRCPDDGETAASRGEIGTSLPHLDSTRLLLGLTSSEDDSQDQPRPQLRRRACAVDRHFGLEDKFTPDELALLLKTRAFVDDEVLPTIGGFWEPAGFPRDLAKRMGELGLVGDGIEGHGCPPMSPMAPELVNMELNRRDGSLGTFPGVQSGLAMKSIDMLGSDRAEATLAAGARLGRPARRQLTEPLHGSDSVGLETTARRDGEGGVVPGWRSEQAENGAAVDTEGGAVDEARLL